MKRFLINFVAEMVFDEIINALSKIARKSSSKVDDKMIVVLKANRAELIREIKKAV